jgi:hypothetical protein
MSYETKILPEVIQEAERILTRRMLDRTLLLELEHVCLNSRRNTAYVGWALGKLVEQLVRDFLLRRREQLSKEEQDLVERLKAAYCSAFKKEASKRGVKLPKLESLDPITTREEAEKYARFFHDLRACN